MFAYYRFDYDLLRNLLTVSLLRREIPLANRKRCLRVSTSCIHISPNPRTCPDIFTRSAAVCLDLGNTAVLVDSLIDSSDDELQLIDLAGLAERDVFYRHAILKCDVLGPRTDAEPERLRSRVIPVDLRRPPVAEMHDQAADLCRMIIAEPQGLSDSQSGCSLLPGGYDISVHRAVRLIVIVYLRILYEIRGRIGRIKRIPLQFFHV